MSSLQGKLLIASPHLLDPNFIHSVVYLMQHSDEGALGVVLNRPSDSTIGEVWTEVLEQACDNPQSIYLGGPCPGPLMALHKDARRADLQVADEIFVATQKEHLEALVEEAMSPLRIFSGYSGWAGGQLEEELEVGSWLVADASEARVFDEDPELWKLLSRQVGENILFATLGIKHAPEDPALN